MVIFRYRSGVAADLITIATFLSYCEPPTTSALTPKRPRSRAPWATHEQAGSRPAQKRYKLIAGEIGVATDLLVREELQNLFLLKFIGPSKRWNFAHRTESAESRASEINGPFGE